MSSTAFGASRMLPNYLISLHSALSALDLAPHPLVLASIMSQGQASIPSQPRAKQLRACLLCSVIQTPADFRKHGCPNCEELMQVCSTLYATFVRNLTYGPMVCICTDR